MTRSNQSALVFLIVIAILAGGYAWYSYMYTPAVERKAAATQALTAAQQELDSAKRQLAQVMSEGTDKEDLAKLVVVNNALTYRTNVEESITEVERMARSQGVMPVGTSVQAAAEASAPAAAGGPEGAELHGTTVEFRAHAPVRDVVSWVRDIQNLVRYRSDGRIYVKGRFINIAGIKIERPEDTTLPRGHYLVTLTYEVFAWTTASAGSATGVADPATGDSGALPATGADAATAATNAANAAANGTTGTTADGTATTPTTEGTTGGPS